MIIIKTWGGIGNQLFQFVFGQYVHHKHHQEVRYDDNSFITTDMLRKNELDALNIKIDWDNRRTFSKYKGVKGRLLRYFYQVNPRHHYIGKEEGIPQEYKPDEEYYFQSYWQDYKYYAWLRAYVPSFIIEIKEMPSELLQIRNKITSTLNSVSIHVRRGDYFKPAFIGTYGVCTEDYFEKALTEIRERVSCPHFFLFSDDLEWVDKHLELGDGVEIVPNYDVSQFAYIELMSQCRHHIISNSSFSWWGAVLNEQKDAIVISPKRWTLADEKTIALDKWIKI